MNNNIIWYEDNGISCAGYSEALSNIRFSIVSKYDNQNTTERRYIIYAWDDQLNDYSYLLKEHPSPSGYINMKAAQDECKVFLKQYMES